MKKILFAIITTVFSANSTFAQYPLPTSQVNGNLYVTDSVGIGTTAPNSTLHVAGTSYLSDAAVNKLVVGVDSVPLLNGALTALLNGATLSSIVGNWKLYSSSSSNNITSKVSSVNAAMNTVNGDYIYLEVDTNQALLGNFNLTDDTKQNALSLNKDGAFISLTRDDAVFSVSVGDKRQILISNDTINFGNSLDPTTILYKDGNQASGYVLTSDANGVANWSVASESTLYTDVTEATTTTTDWEVLTTYDIPANTLSANGNVLEIDFEQVASVTADSLKLVLGSTTIYIDNNAGVNNDLVNAKIVRKSAGNQMIFSGSEFNTATEDETTQLTLTFQAKSVTIGNQSLPFFKVRRLE